MKIVFTDIAKKRLRGIYKHYKNNASLKVAQSIKGKILTDIKKLKYHSELGNREDFLVNLGKGYRKLISGNYKIIYRVVEKGIVIDTIFDTRQEPIELSKGL